MPTSRLKAFSDGVLAIIITIMVLYLAPSALSALSAPNSLGSLCPSSIPSPRWVH